MGVVVECQGESGPSPGHVLGMWAGFGVDGALGGLHEFGGGGLSLVSCHLSKVVVIFRTLDQGLSAWPGPSRRVTVASGLSHDPGAWGPGWNRLLGTGAPGAVWGGVGDARGISLFSIQDAQPVTSTSGNPPSRPLPHGSCPDFSCFSGQNAMWFECDKYKSVFPSPSICSGHFPPRQYNSDITISKQHLQRAKR